MARNPESDRSGPAIILVEPQLAENIGTAARAMANFGLSDLRIVHPRDGWPNERARAAASGAVLVERVTVFASLQAAIADLSFLYATTARQREIPKEVHGPREAVARLRARAPTGAGTGILFGRERTGLTNEEVSVADAVLTLPVDPSFASVNVAQSVLIIAYEWRLSGLAAEGAGLPFGGPSDPPASKEDLIGFFDHLEAALDEAGFFRPAEKRPHMMLGLRAMLQRAGLTEQEVRTLRGVVAALERRPTRPRKLPDGTVTTERGKR